MNPVGGEWERVIDPATGEVIAEVPRGTEEDVDRAVVATSRAFDAAYAIEDYTVVKHVMARLG
jgi:acyl-CoA reductase-like NAD-dependent aldehyde dehydrogenase